MGGVINKVNNEFESNRLVNKYFKMITVPIVILVMIINTVVVFYYSSVWKNEMKAKQTEQLHQYRDEFEKTQRNAEILYTWFLKDDIASRYFMLEDLYELKGMEASELFNSLTQSIITVSSINTEIEQVYLYNFSMNYYIGRVNSGFIDDKSPDWYEKYNYMQKKGNSSTIVCDSEKITYFLEVTNFGEKIGLIVFETELPRPVYNLTEKFEISIAKDNKIIYSTKEEKIGNVVDIKEEYRSKNGGIKNYGKTVALLDNSNDSGFLYYSLNDNVYSTENIRFIIGFILISIILMILTCLALSFVFGREVKKLAVSLMSIIENPKADKNESKVKEINYIVKSIFSKEEGSIEALGEMLAKKMNILKSSQIIALQTQITPHFLYNTLQSINLVAMSKFKGKNEVSDMVFLFSNILHNALDTETYTVTLQKEVEYVKSYLTLQNYRYPNRVEVVWNIDEETLAFETVKFSLQPIIENALTHGVYLLSRKCTLWINAFFKDGELLIEIKNDGKPMEKEKLKEVNEVLQKQEIVIKESRSIGLSNVNQRIKLIFGKEYGISMSEENGITIAKIKLPKIKEF